MGNSLRVLFVGLGSIGRRHLRNLYQVASQIGLKMEVDALRHDGSLTLAPEIQCLIDKQYTSISDLNVPYDLILICNPSQMHIETLLALKDIGKTFFVEKPVSVKPISDVTMKRLGDPSRYRVACPLRHTSVFRAIRDFVAGNKVLSARAICSSYLPDWRPGVDYSKLYSARRESGGVKVDLVHEFDYLFTVFGFPAKSALFESKISDLAIECADVALFMGMYPTMSLEVRLDYFGRKAERSLTLWTPDDVVSFDFISGKRKSLVSGNEFLVGDKDRNDMYLSEMTSLLMLVKGEGDNVNDLHFANKVISEVGKSAMPMC